MAKDGIGRMRPTSRELLLRASRLTIIPPAVVSAVHDSTGPVDTALLAACAAANAIQERKLATFTGSTRIDDDDDRNVVLDELDGAQLPHLLAAARLRPTTWTGHTLRAISFLLWDAGSLDHAARQGSAGDKLLAAIVDDLAAS